MVAMIRQLRVRIERDFSATVYSGFKVSPRRDHAPVSAIVCGGRDFDDWILLESFLLTVNLKKVIHGAARGADSMAGEFARKGGIEEVAVSADWEKRGRSAGIVRNAEMLALDPDIVIGFPGGKGTSDMTFRAHEAGKTVYKVQRMPQFSYTAESIFDIDADVLVNPVNCKGVSGAGLAREFAQRYPAETTQYEKNCIRQRMKLGQVFGCEREGCKPGDYPTAIVFFPTKNHWQDPSDLMDIVAGLRDLQVWMRWHGSCSVVIPAIGAGLGGLSWDRVKQEIESRFLDTDIDVVVCEPR